MKPNLLNVSIVAIMILLFVGITFYPPKELTRYILAYIQEMGEVPQFTPDDFIMEIAFIWTGYLIGIAMFGVAVWKYLEKVRG